MKPTISRPPRLYLTPQDQGRVLSLEEFEAAGSEEGYRYELIDGRLEVSPIPGRPHEGLAKWLERLLDRYAEQHPQVINLVHRPARVFVPGRPGTTCPEPDVAAYLDPNRNRPLFEQRWQDVSPLLVVEVISADTADKGLVRNRPLYWQVPSIQEYWILETRQGLAGLALLVHRRGKARWRRPLVVPFGGTYATPLLPGFSLLVNPQP